MQARFGVIVILGIVLSACGDNTTESSKNINQSDFNKVMEKASNETYDPPENGQLTEDQIKMYMAVKKHEAELIKTEAEKVKEKVNKVDKSQDGSISGTLQSMDAIKQLAGYATLDIRAAQELNYNSEEYQWVKEALYEASSNAMMVNTQVKYGEKYNEMIKNLEDSIASLEKTRDESTGPEKQALNEQIKDAKQQVAQMKNDGLNNNNTLSPAQQHNMELYAKYEKEINLYQNEMNKWEQINK